MSHITEAVKYGFEFLQRININYSLYGHGGKRLILHNSGKVEPISYIIEGPELQPFSWNLFKSNSPLNSIDDAVRC